MKNGRLLTTESVVSPTNASRLREFEQSMSHGPDVADAYVALLGALRLRRPSPSSNSILVTSTEPGEGKTTVASGLAITASLANQTVLLIDGDLRRSSLASLIGVADTVGLTEVLLGQADAAEAIHPLAELTDSPKTNLVSVMAGGRKSARFLPAIDWVKARSAFKSISHEFSIVLMDSPPILAANDALLLAGVVDAVLLVVGAGSANLDEVRSAKEQLDRIGAPIVGVVLNRFEPKVHGKSNQPYRGYNGRSQP